MKLCENGFVPELKNFPATRAGQSPWISKFCQSPVFTAGHITTLDGQGIKKKSC